MYCFAKICRLCLSHDSALIHCRARDKNNIPNYHKIKVLFPQLVTKTSQHFPIWICTKCQEQVNQSYDFKQKCYKTYKLLRKYSLQLYEANREKNIPDVPTEIFQEVKPKIDNNIISIDEEDRSNSYYNADDITIVKNELLPQNLKNEPEYNNMIQAIIDNNMETITEIHGESPMDVKREMMNTSRSQEEEVEQEPVQTENTENAENTENMEVPVPETTQTTSAVLSAFTLDYTNTSFETFASHVAPNITVNSTLETNNNKENEPRGLITRSLRQRKSICYRTMEKCFDSLFEPLVKRRTRSASPKKPPQTPKKSPQTPKKSPQTPKKGKPATISPKTGKPATISPKTGKPATISPKTVRRASEIIDKVLTSEKKKVSAPFSCEKCSKQYVRFNKFTLHTSICKGLFCSVCKKVYSCEGNLKRHEKVHMPKVVRSGVRFSCKLCRNQYVKDYYYRRHLKMRHNLILDNSNPLF